jgi:hypothetical protein
MRSRRGTIKATCDTGMKPRHVRVSSAVRRPTHPSLTRQSSTNRFGFAVGRFRSHPDAVVTVGVEHLSDCWKTESEARR